MAKKLTVEVETETSKAKRKLQELAETGGSPAGADAVSSAANRTARALDKVSRSASSVAEETGKSSASMTRLFRSFAGIGAGMAAGYAANHMAPGAGRTALGYTSSILSGAATGAMMGSVIPGVGTAAGAVVGGAVGAGKQYLDNSDSEKNWFKAFKAGEESFQASKAWASRFEELTSVKTHFKGLSGVDELKAQLAEVDAASKRTADAIKQLKYSETVRLAELKSLEKREDLTADERIKRATEEAAALAITRQKLAQTEGAAKGLSKMRDSLEDAIDESNKPKHDFRASTDALDALSRIGGNFGGGDLARDQLRTQQEMAATLKSIDQKANGGGIWQ